jgi:serine/threonine protein kinase
VTSRLSGRSETFAAALAGRYAVERELGAGGMATVYLAEDVRHHRKVAVKVLRPELSAALGPERFLKEIELTAALQHPHILPLFDSGEAAGQLYYVMPYVEGEPPAGGSGASGSSRWPTRCGSPPRSRPRSTTRTGAASSTAT